jgi:hypothetical protein
VYHATVGFVPCCEDRAHTDHSWQQYVLVRAAPPLRFGCSTEDVCHDLDRCILHVRHDVRVDTQGDRDVRMAQHLTHHLWVHTMAEQYRCRRVAQIMEPDIL